MDKNNSNKINFNSLPFANEIAEIFEYLQYSVSSKRRTLSQNGSLSEKLSYYGSLKSLYSLLNKLNINDIIEYKNEHLQNLQQNPLLLGCIEVVEKVYHAKSVEELEKIYDAYQALQKDYPFETHKQDYIDMGCNLTTGYLIKEDKIKLSYPVTLYTAYAMHGGNSDEIRLGNFDPVHELNKNELNEIYEIYPSLIENNKNILEVYNNLMNYKQ